MTDYYQLMIRAIANLDKSTGETRRALYGRVRTVPVESLRNFDPLLSESEITRERLMLEEAIRKVEADARWLSRSICYAIRLGRYSSGSRLDSCGSNLWTHRQTGH
jgi:hypothetical protein